MRVIPICNCGAKQRRKFLNRVIRVSPGAAFGRDVYSALHNKPELPFFAKLVCATLFGLKTEIQPLRERLLRTS